MRTGGSRCSPHVRSRTCACVPRARPPRVSSHTVCVRTPTIMLIYCWRILQRDVGYGPQMGIVPRRTAQLSVASLSRRLTRRSCHAREQPGKESAEFRQFETSEKRRHYIIIGATSKSIIPCLIR